VHPQNRGDLERTDAWFRRYDDQALPAVLRHLEPVYLGEVAIDVSSGTAIGPCALFGVPALPEQVLAGRHLARAWVNHVLGMTAPWGIGALGLGALLGAHGPQLQSAPQTPLHPLLTHGNALTAATTVVGLAGLLGRTLFEEPLLIVGASGSLGRLIALLLARAGARLVLGGRNRARLERVAAQSRALGARSVETTTALVERMAQADVLILAVSTAVPIVSLAALRPGAWVIDMAQPQSVLAPAESHLGRHWIRDILLRPRGELRLTYDLHLPERTLYACLVETMLLAAMRPNPWDWVRWDVALEAVDAIWAESCMAGFDAVVQSQEVVAVTPEPAWLARLFPSSPLHR